MWPQWPRFVQSSWCQTQVVVPGRRHWLQGQPNKQCPRTRRLAPTVEQCDARQPKRPAMKAMNVTCNPLFHRALLHVPTGRVFASVVDRATKTGMTAKPPSTAITSSSVNGRIIVVGISLLSSNCVCIFSSKFAGRKGVRPVASGTCPIQPVGLDLFGLVLRIFACWRAASTGSSSHAQTARRS